MPSSVRPSVINEVKDNYRLSISFSLTHAPRAHRVLILDKPSCKRLINEVISRLSVDSVQSPFIRFNKLIFILMFD
jgi:hypothetical protein